MDTLLPDFDQTTFVSRQPIDNQYFPCQRDSSAT